MTKKSVSIIVAGLVMGGLGVAIGLTSPFKNHVPKQVIAAGGTSYSTTWTADKLLTARRTLGITTDEAAIGVSQWTVSGSMTLADGSKKTYTETWAVPSTKPSFDRIGPPAVTTGDGADWLVGSYVPPRLDSGASNVTGSKITISESAVGAVSSRASSNAQNAGKGTTCNGSSGQEAGVNDVCLFSLGTYAFGTDYHSALGSVATAPRPDSFEVAIPLKWTVSGTLN